MSKIEWTDETWNPVTGCAKVSAGCKNCFAETVAFRFWGDRKFTDVRMHPERLEQPFRWRKPRRVFANSMSDLFHDDVPDEFLDQVFAVMALSPQHTFQVLTKRPERMLRWFTGGIRRNIPVYNAAADILKGDWSRAPGDMASTRSSGGTWWPLRNVWLGVSVEDQRSADARIPVLLRTPAAVRFVSAEPLLGTIAVHLLDRHTVRDDDCCADWCLACERRQRLSIPLDAGIDWVIVGGESGPHARPCDVGWVRRIVEQCRDARVPCFVKQLGASVFCPTRLAWRDCGRQSDLFDRERPRQSLATVWYNGTWHTWDARGIGGENSVEATVEQAKAEAIESLATQHVHAPREWERHRHGFSDPKGGDPAEWPADLRVREFPAATLQRGNPGASKAKANPLGRERAAE